MKQVEIDNLIEQVLKNRKKDIVLSNYWTKEKLSELIKDKELDYGIRYLILIKTPENFWEQQTSLPCFKSSVLETACNKMARYPEMVNEVIHISELIGSLVTFKINEMMYYENSNFSKNEMIDAIEEVLEMGLVSYKNSW